MIVFWTGARSGNFGSKSVALGAAHGLHGHQVRPGPLPAARQRAAVEVDHDLELGRVLQDVVVEADDVLLVALEEVDLDALDAPLLQQLELEAADLAVGRACRAASR